MIWVSRVIEVGVPGLGVWSRLRPETGRTEDSCDAELLSGLGAGFERVVRLAGRDVVSESERWWSRTIHCPTCLHHGT